MIHIFYRHTDKLSKGTYRPEWFDFDDCFTNLIDSIKNYEDYIKLYMIFDGQINGSFIEKFSNLFELIEINAGSDKNSFFITNDIIKSECDRDNIKDGDLIYLLENDYLHVKDWIPKVKSFFEKNSEKYVSLYDHADKYFENNLTPSLIYLTDNSHWRTTTSTCGSFIISKKVFLEDFYLSKKLLETSFDIGITPDHFRFLMLNLYKKREIVTPIPALSTHVINDFMSPIINWKNINFNFENNLKICLYDHHDFIIPTDGIGGVIGLFQIMVEGFKKENIDLTIIVNDKSTLESENNMKVIKLPFHEINEIKYGKQKISKYFNNGIFFSNSSGRHVNFDFSDFKGKWVSCCHGCLEYVGNSDYQVFVSNNQLKQHFRDNLFENYCNNYKVIHNSVNIKEYFWEEGEHNRLVWMGRIDGAKAERLYEIALITKEKILAAGSYSEEWKWLFDKIMSTNNVEWVGKIEGVKNKRKFYSNAKLSIHCSSFDDPCPLTVLEAQACGIPVISYANGSMDEICYFKDLICRDIESFKDKLETFNKINESKILTDFIKKNFSQEKYIKEWINFFKQISYNNKLC